MNIFTKKAFSVVEYTVLFVIIIGAFLVMRNYIQRGIYGNWNKTGQSYSNGRQYDSQKTVECSFDEQSNVWYDRNCYNDMVNKTCIAGDNTCQEGIITGTCETSACSQGPT